MFLAMILATVLAAFAAGAVIAHSLTIRKVKKIHAHDKRRRAAIFSMVSHEIKTPMTSMLGLISIINENSTGAEAANAQRFAKVSENANILNTVFTDVYDIVKAEAHTLRLDPELVHLGEMTKEIIDLAQKKNIITGQKIHVDFSKAPTKTFKVDAVRIRQCLSTLLKQNCLQTPDGDITIRLERGDQKNLYQMIFECDAKAAQKDIANLLTPESYEESRFLRGRPSAALSLFTAKVMAMVMGGDIIASRSAKGGVRFQFTFKAVALVPSRAAPRKPSEPPSIAPGAVKTSNATVSRVAAAPAAPVAPGSIIAGARGLVVDDNATNLLVLKSMLGAFGMNKISTFDNGFDALEELQKNIYDVVFMDIQMPQIDGIQTTQKIRALGSANARIPVIAVTAGSRIFTRDNYRDHQFDGYIEKPLSQQALVTELQKLSPRIKSRLVRNAA